MNNTIPNLESLVAGFNSPSINPPKHRESPSAKDTPASTSPEPVSTANSTLWNEFVGMLSAPKDESSSSTGKPYKVDDDIIETIQQCNFKTSSTQVINSILRTFLLANLNRLREMRIQPIQSLFDKYPQDENNR